MSILQAVEDEIVQMLEAGDEVPERMTVLVSEDELMALWKEDSGENKLDDFYVTLVGRAIIFSLDCENLDSTVH